MSRRTAGRLGRALVISALLFIVAGALGIATAQAAPAPGGNNGTVKISEQDADNGNANDPHVGCVFDVKWFGFDVGTRSSTVTFDGQSPTGGGELLVDNLTFQGQGSGNSLDHVETYDLSPYLAGITPHHNQGWHVKVTVNTDGSKGSDKKHKVFWVEGCFGPTVGATPCSGPGGGNGILLTIKNNDVSQNFTIDQDGNTQIVNIGSGNTKTVGLPHTAATNISVTDSFGHEVDKSFGAPDCSPPQNPEKGSITLEKNAEGAESPADSTPFGFTISCVDAGAVLDKTGTFTLTPAQNAQTVAHDVLTNTNCTITETDDGNATSSGFKVNGVAAGSSSAVEVTVTSTSAVVVVMTNQFDPPPCEVGCGPPPCEIDCGPPPCQIDCGPPPCQVDCGPPTTETLGRITLDKLTTGNNVPAGDPTFTFSVSCADPDATVVAAPSIKPSDAPLLVASDLSLNTSCTITETGDQGATGVSWTVNGSPASSSHTVSVTILSGSSTAVVASNDFTAEITPPVIQPVAQTPDEVLGAEIVRPALARTGFNTGRLVVTGLCMLITGLALLGWSKRAAALNAGSMVVMIDAPVEQPRIPRTLRRKSL